MVYADANGELRSITTDLTDFYPPDEFRQIADGRAAFRTHDLIGLWQVLDQLRHEEEADDA